MEEVNATTTTKQPISKNRTNQNGNTATTPNSTIQNFLNSHRIVDKNTLITHTSFDGGSFHIDDHELSTFFDLYAGVITSHPYSLSIVETHNNKEYFPLLVDLDMKFDYIAQFNDMPILPHCYTIQFVDQFLRTMFLIIERTLKITENMDRIALVFEKTEPTLIEDTDILKDGIHIIFPNIIANSDVQEYIRTSLIKEVEHIFYDTITYMKWSPINPIADVIDRSILRSNGWLMYLSRKKRNPVDPTDYRLCYRLISDGTPQLSCCGAWMVTAQHATLMSASELTSMYGNSRILVELLSIRNKTAFDSCEVQTETSARIQEEQAKQRKQIKEKASATCGYEVHVTDEYNLELAKQLVAILNPSRAVGYASWMEVGWCLHNIDYRLLETWIAFSHTDPKHEHEPDITYEMEWKKMKKHGLLLGTLCYWAKTDNPEAYRQIKETSFEYLINQCCLHFHAEKGEAKTGINDTIYYIVKVLYYMYRHEFVCSVYNRKEWYMFNGQYWILSDGDVTLRKLVSKELFDAFNTVYVNAKQKVQALEKQQETESSQYKRYQKLCSCACMIATKIRNVAVKKSIMEEACEVFHWESNDGTTFEQLLNSNRRLVGLKNGVYDLDADAFRQGRSDDFISVTTKNDYIEFTWDHPIIIEIMTLVSQILPVVEVRDHVLKMFSTCLSGGDGQEKFYIFIGCGGNGKSKLLELLQMAIGAYSAVLSVAAITNIRAQSSAPSPDIARLKDVRFTSLQEPKKNEEINGGKLKELTGGDRITARGLHKDPIEFKIASVFILSCNHCPRFQSDDGGLCRRIRLIPFPSRFVENPNPEMEYEFVRDYELERKLDKWKEGFFWILTQYYKFYKFGCAERKISPKLDKEPADIKAKTQLYIRKNDFIQQFLDKYTVRGTYYEFAPLDGNTGLYETYKAACKDDTMPTLTKNDFVEALEIKLGGLSDYNKKKGWTRIRLLSRDEISQHNPEEVHQSSQFQPPTITTATTTTTTGNQIGIDDSECSEGELKVPL